MSKESGVRKQRYDFARESSLGVLGSDPAFLPYSSVISEFEWGGDGVVNEPRRGAGSPDPVGFTRGPEEHELSIVYELEQWFTSGGDALDASYDGVFRDENNDVPNTHAFVHRVEVGNLNASETVNGSQSYDTRGYTVGHGGVIGECGVMGDPSDNQEITVEMTYTFQKVRTYQIDQPDASTQLVVYSTDASDTDLTVEIEDEGASTTETVTLDGSDATTLASTTSNFEDIDAIWVPDEHKGDIVVTINEGDDQSPTEGDTLAIIRGSDNYNGVESDSGVPALGSGSRSVSSGTPEVFIGSSFEHGTIADPNTGAPLAYEVAAANFIVENELETTARASGYGMDISVGNRTMTAEMTCFGQSTSHQSFEKMLTSHQSDLVWTLNGGTLQIDDAIVSEAGARAMESGLAVMTVENVLEGTGITITEA